MGRISNFFEKDKIFSTFVVAKNYNERGSYLNFAGKGISISMDIPINKNILKVKSFFNDLFIQYNTKINLSKDSILYKNFLIYDIQFLKFKKVLILVYGKKKLNSFFSQRLGI